MLNITEKIQLSAEKLEKIKVISVKMKTREEEIAFINGTEHFKKQARQHLITSQKELAKSIIEEFEIKELESKCTCGCEFKDGCLCLQDRDGFNKCKKAVNEICERLKKQL